MRKAYQQASGLGVLLALAGCATVPKALDAPPPTRALPPPPRVKVEGLGQVVGHNATALTTLLGKPEQDLREANGRRLQFAGGGCVLDAYLYPPQAGREAVVTYVEARLADGRDTDRAACVTAQIKARGHEAR